MAIRKVTESTQLKVGDWVVCANSLFIGRLGKPAQVTKVAGKRVYLQVTHKSRKGEELDTESKQKHLKSVLFVCDSKAEAQSLQEFNIKHMNQTAEMVAKLRSDRNQDYAEGIDKLIEESL